MAKPSIFRKCDLPAALVLILGTALGGPSLAAPVNTKVADAAEHKDIIAIRELLKQHADVNTPQPDGATALHWAVHWDDVETASVLLRAGANVNAVNDLGIAPLHLACSNGNATLAALLLKSGANPNATPETGETPLMLAARSGNVEVVKALLNAGAVANGKDSARGQTALMWAISEQHADVSRLLIEKGADVNARSRGEFTPLLFAARYGDLDLSRLLLASGAKIDDAAPDGSTPLLIAATGQVAYAGKDFKITESPGEHENVAIFLLENGADPDKADSFGHTALHLAVQTGKRNLIKALIAHHANLNAQMTRDEIPYRGDFVPRNGLIGATPFFLAARASDLELMRLLAEAGADPNLATKSGITPLMTAAGANQNESRLPPESQVIEAMKLCLQWGNKVNQIAGDGQTAVHFATQMGEDAVIQYLFDHGANPDVKDKRGHTPMYIALNNPSRPRPQTAALLRKLIAEAGTAR